jgi:hypothetical protein
MICCLLALPPVMAMCALYHGARKLAGYKTFGKEGGELNIGFSSGGKCYKPI